MKSIYCNQLICLSNLCNLLVLLHLFFFSCNFLFLRNQIICFLEFLIAWTLLIAYLRYLVYSIFCIFYKLILTFKGFSMLFFSCCKIVLQVVLYIPIRRHMSGCLQVVMSATVNGHYLAPLIYYRLQNGLFRLIFQTISLRCPIKTLWTPQTYHVRNGTNIFL